MLHHLLREMIRRGHEAEVIAAQGSGEWIVDGVCCHGNPDGRLTHCLYEWSEIVVTHLDLTSAATEHAINHQRPVVHIVHNPDQLRYHAVTADVAQLVVANSQWVAKHVNPSIRTVIVHPPVDAKRYQVVPGRRVTLSNLSRDKGAYTFYDLARRIPTQQFLGVAGAYGHQIHPPDGLTNVEVWENQADVRSVYAETRVLLMPSRFETWGRVGVEAACSGIPVIAAPTPGILEALADSAIYCDWQDHKQWEYELRRLLDDEDHWREMSRRVKARAKKLHPRRDYDTFERALKQVVKSGEVAWRPRYFSGRRPSAWA